MNEEVVVSSMPFFNSRKYTDILTIYKKILDYWLFAGQDSTYLERSFVNYLKTHEMMMRLNVRGLLEGTRENNKSSR